MASPTAKAARFRGMLDEWSDDDEDIVPKRTERSSSKSVTPGEDLDMETVSPPQPDSPKIPPTRKRLSRSRCLDSDDDEAEEPSRFAKVAKAEPSPPSPKAKVVKLSAVSVEVSIPPPEMNRPHQSSAPLGPAMQAPVQPGCTQLNDGNSRFLAYNMLGCISRVETEAGFAHVEVDFHDTSKGMRVPSMTDFFGFTMAAMNESGSVFANPQNGDKTPSTIMYRPFNSWTSNSEV